MQTKLNRRELVANLAASAAVGLSESRAALADPAWADWRDLLNFAPDKSALVAARTARHRPPLQFDIQRISDASKPTVNLDNFGVSITKMPRLNGNTLTDIQLLTHVRKNLNSFFDPGSAQISEHLPEDLTEWNQEAMPLLGTIMVFHIPVLGIGERGAVVVSKVATRSWIFSPVKIGVGIIGSHPVAGNREFGIKTVGAAQVLYVRAADRPYDNVPPESVVFNGADKLWTSYQERVKQFVNDNGGAATIVTPVKYRPAWKQVVDEGYYKS